MKSSNPFKLIIAVIVSELAGLIGSIFTVPAISSWYSALAKPALNPPDWIFAPVWNTLFVLMGIAAFLVWKKGLEKREVRIALLVFISQLILNSLWSFIFFGLHNPGAAFFELIILWLAILATIIIFHKISPKAAYLLIPYILWVTFAGYLNFSIWQLAVNAAAAPVENIACTLEAKICSDGSAVGRSGPNCEFGACPPVEINNTPEGWVTFTDRSLNLSFNYPVKLMTEYTSSVNWPPKISVSTGSFTCPETAPTNSLPARVSRRLVDNRVYCLEAMSEGAAGSVYTDYIYTTEKDSKLITITFTLRAVQCANYDDPQKTACENERQSFDLDSVIDRIVRTIE